MNTMIAPSKFDALRAQGKLFCVLTIAVLIASPLLAAIDERLLLIGIAVAIFFLGVPHGALDTVFAKKIYRLDAPVSWLIFSFTYVSLAAAVVMLWSYAPLIFLAGFLLISAFHFSGDPVADLPPGTRLLYGGAVVVLPAMLHAPKVSMLFAQLVGAAVAGEIVSVLQIAAVPWLVASLLFVALLVRTDRLAACEIFCVILLSVVAAPLVGFTVFFCGMHSPRHFLRTASLVAQPPKNLLHRAALLPMLACGCAVIVAVSMMAYLPIDDRLVQIIFVGLAALTVPHMLLIERVRLRGWRFASD